MASAPMECYSNDKLVPTIREFFSHYPQLSHCGAETLAELLHAKRFLRYRPTVPRVEVALLILDVERGEA